MVLFGLGSVAYFCLLLINSVAILNKERFLTPLGLTSSSSSGLHAASSSSSASGSVTPGGGPYSNHQYDAYGASGAIGGGGGGGLADDGLKSRIVQLVDAVRTLMRSECPPPYAPHDIIPD